MFVYSAVFVGEQILVVELYTLHVYSVLEFSEVYTKVMQLQGIHNSNRVYLW